MTISMHRIRVRLRTNAAQYAKCSAKTGTFLACATVYVFVLKLTIFKPQENVVKIDGGPKWTNKWPKEYEEERVESVLSNITEEQYLALMSEYAARVWRVQETCRRHNLTHRSASQAVNSREFFVAGRSRPLVWCNIFKAASSAWLYNLNILGGYSHKFLSRTHQAPLTLARRLYPRLSAAALLAAIADPATLSFLVVREPFERLLSAFRDKLEDLGPPFYRKLARTIVRHYRPTTERLFGAVETSGPTFYEFVKYITDGYRSKGDDFVFDEHWAPYYKFCTPCLIGFKMVAKVETLRRDNEFLVRELGLADELEGRPTDKKTRVKVIMNKSRDGMNTTGLLRRYFGKIDRQMLSDLMDIYRIDFEMFGYDATVYEKYVSNLTTVI